MIERLLLIALVSRAAAGMDVFTSVSTFLQNGSLFMPEPLSPPFLQEQPISFSPQQANQQVIVNNQFRRALPASNQTTQTNSSNPVSSPNSNATGSDLRSLNSTGNSSTNQTLFDWSATTTAANNGNASTTPLLNSNATDSSNSSLNASNNATALSNATNSSTNQNQTLLAGSINAMNISTTLATATANSTDMSSSGDDMNPEAKKYFIAILIVVIFCFVFIAVVLVVLILSRKSLPGSGRSDHYVINDGGTSGAINSHSSGYDDRDAHSRNSKPVVKDAATNTSFPMIPANSPSTPQVQERRSYISNNLEYPRSPTLQPPPTVVRQEFPLVSMGDDFAQQNDDNPEAVVSFSDEGDPAGKHKRPSRHSSGNLAPTTTAEA